MIYTTSQDGILGINNNIPWNINIVMARYRVATQGKLLIVGRNTWEALLCLVSEHEVIVLSSRPLGDKKVMQADSLTAALDMAEKAGHHDVMIVGGSRVFQEAMGVCHVIYKSTILLEVRGNVYAPIIPNARFKLVWVKNFKANPAYSYQTYILKEFDRKILSADFGLLYL